ncbi:prepilin peptidase [Arsenicicoccus dermatophilus]|uniref:prepilin peptidase n=1 Tax=Arsenicicoccus dermatophilus TaxID=1076331 RepID=UPI001F4CD697|nr:prepilin peptidase [Arsenicicoccus dermatophilus]
MPLPVLLTSLALAGLGLPAGRAVTRWGERRGYLRPGDRPRRDGSLRWVTPACVLLPALVAAVLASRGHGGLALVVGPLVWGMVALAVVDLDVHRLPDRLQLPAYPLVALLLAALAAVTRNPAPLVRSGSATVVVLAVGSLLWLTAPRHGLGLGDVKLAGLLAALLAQLGWSQVLLGLWLGLVLGGAQALALLATRRAGRGDHLALGPPLLAGTLLALAAG